MHKGKGSSCVQHDVALKREKKKRPRLTERFFFPFPFPQGVVLSSFFPHKAS